MLRCSNLIPQSLGDTDTNRQLTWSRVFNHSGGVVFHIILSKTLQFRERVHEVALSAAAGSLFCPCTALQSLASIKGPENCKSDDLVFTIPQGNKWVPLTKQVAQDVLSQQIRLMGLDPTHERFRYYK